MSAAGGDRRYTGIEALRFASAVAVVFWHYQHFFMSVGGAFAVPFDPAAQPLHGLFRVFYAHGWAAVWAFWQISGFIFFWKYHEAIAAGRVSAGDFFVLRFSRLYPLHAATLLAVATMQFVHAAGPAGGFFVYADNDLRHFVLNLFFASAWGFERGMSFNGPVWSVSVEVLVYAFFFVVSLRFRLGLLGRLAVVAAAIALRAVNARYALVPEVRMILDCVTYFFMGGAVHAAVVRLTPDRARSIAPVALLAAALIWALAFRDEYTTPKWALLAVSTLLLVGFLGLDLWRGVDRFLARIAPLADTTYSSYLVHFPVQLAAVSLTDALGWSRTIYLSPLALGLFLATTFGLGWIVFHRFERPVQERLRRMMSARRVGTSDDRSA